jgi:SDR family mycofactocin-dependent oxidoreductase
MSGRVQGKVALITGAARGQGRAHAVTLAREGADIIAVDICAQPDWANYPLATQEDLAETVRQVEALDRRISSHVADVRDKAAMDEVVAAGIAEFGRIDIVVANAGIVVLGHDEPDTVFLNTVEINLSGVMNTINAALPHLTEGASVVATGSYAGLTPLGIKNGPGGGGYSYAKRGVASLVSALALQLGGKSIRVNAVHPGNCNTDMLHSKPMYKVFRPDLEDPQREDVLDSFASMQILPIPYVEPEDISNAVLFLASDDSRYVTGLQLRVDGGALLKAGVTGL